MITGAAKMDCGILVVSATDGAKPQTREHILLCKQVGVQHIIIFINKCDLEQDEMLHELVEEEVKDLLTQYGFDAANTKCVKGSALATLENRDNHIGLDRVKELLDIMDTEIPIAARPVEKDFQMSIESTLNIEGRGTVVTGTVDFGKIKVGQELEVVGFSQQIIPTSVTGIESFRKLLDYAEAGDNVGILLRGVNRDSIRRGMVLAKPGSIKPNNCFKAQIYVLTEDEGGRSKGFSSGFRPQVRFFYFRNYIFNNFSAL
jgi:elongation factor Tu